MAQMHPEQDKAEQIKTGDQRVVETQDDHGRHIMPPFQIVEVRMWAHPRGKLQHVENQEAQDNQPAQGHGAHGDRALHPGFHRIPLRAGPTVFDDQ